MAQAGMSSSKALGGSTPKGGCARIGAIAEKEKGEVRSLRAVSGSATDRET